MSLPFLLEIGCEEIPDWMIVPAVNHLRELFQGLLDQYQLGGSISWADATPRRLALRADGLIAKQPDSEDLVMGPPKSAGPGASQGFARKMGTTVDALGTEITVKGEYLSFRRRVTGREASAILAESLPGLILKIYFPKTMYWTGKGGPRWIRPIRWIVALLGSNVVPFELAGVGSGNVSQGHRRLGSAHVPVMIGNYVEELEKNFVLVHAAERREKITSEIAKLGIRVKVEPDLLETLVYVTEYPTPILGAFDRDYLTLPREVLVTVMRHHQKYFSVEDEAGSLAPNFVAVMNTGADSEGLVRSGNERVLRARFNDARFFWDFDQKKKLADRVDELAHVTFQAKLGSYLEKTSRVVELVKALGGNEAAQRAALVAKCDLTTEMVKEFTELQGVIGGLYARAQGEPEPVWRAIYEHYKPTSMDDSIPSTEEGRLVSLADKLDTLRGCFGIGLVPTGSKDPFALRRAAQGVVKILAEGKLALALSELIGDDPQLREFFRDRIQYYFREIRGYKYDEVNAVLASGYDSLPDVEARLAALQGVRSTPNFEPLAASFKRIRNILAQADFRQAGTVDETMLEVGPEYDLYDEFGAVREKVRAVGDYGGALETIATLRPKVDLFFDKVLVNAPDPKVRRNRLTLLYNLLTEFSTIADFSEIVTQS